MKIFAVVALFTMSLLTLPSAGWAQASKPGWETDAAKSLEKAKSEKKMVLMDFTGSDWCPWCVKMDKEVFSTPEFVAYAKENLVLLELDYPHRKLQSPALKEQNQTLKQQYGVQGFPTLVVLGPGGNRLREFGGYQAGGAQAFIAQLDKLKATSTTRVTPPDAGRQVAEDVYGGACFRRSLGE